MTSNIVLTECYPDTELIKIIGVPAKSINHCQGKPKIGYTLEKYKNKFHATAIVDEDPGKPSHKIFSKFILLEEKNEFGIKLKSYNNFLLIELCPDLESWLIKISKQEKIKLENFKLSNKSDILHNQISHTKLPSEYLTLLLSLRNSKSFKYLSKKLK